MKRWRTRIAMRDEVGASRSGFKKEKDGFVYQKCPLSVMEKNRQKHTIKNKKKEKLRIKE